MQKRLKTLATLAAAAFAIVGGAAPIPQEWAVEVSRVRQYQLQANRGDTMELKATFWHDGEPFDLGGETFRLYWQTNAMESVYWSAPATAASNTVSAVFANTMDPGAPIVYGFLGATGGNYRASFSIRFAPGPGAVPNALPLPAATIDFAKVEVLNPPYYTQAEVNSISNALATSIAEIDASAIEEIRGQTETNTTDIATLTIDLAAAASSATNYTDSVAQGLSESIAAAATLTPIYSNTPTFSEWVFSDGISREVFGPEYGSDGFFYAILNDVRTEEIESYEDAIVATYLVFPSNLTATRTRTDIIGYTLGSQSDKPLQPKGDYAPATNIAKSALAQDVQASLAKADTALQTAPVASVNGKTGAVSLTASDVGAVPTAGGTMTGQLIVPMLAVGRFYQAITATEDLDGAHVEICGRWFFEDFSGSRITCRDGMETKSVAFLSDIPSVAGLAPLASPAFTGEPTAPTPASGDDSTKVATTAFVQAAVAGGGGGTPLSGQTFNFATTQGVMDALKITIEALGGTVVNAPSATISQGE